MRTSPPSSCSMLVKVPLLLDWASLHVRALLGQEKRWQSTMRLSGQSRSVLLCHTLTYISIQTGLHFVCVQMMSEYEVHMYVRTYVYTYVCTVCTYTHTSILYVRRFNSTLSKVCFNRHVPRALWRFDHFSHTPLHHCTDCWMSFLHCVTVDISLGIADPKPYLQLCSTCTVCTMYVCIYVCTYFIYVHYVCVNVRTYVHL